ncbi:MAG: 16S rRNA (guanine(527)-N(7))-methyltransferase RsmG [Planctomycetota bacterium]
MTDAPSPLAPPAEFLHAAERLNIAFDPGDLDRLGQYLAMLLDTNTRFNLTAVTDEVTAWTRHILDSLAILPIIRSIDATTVLDVGSGGGLPGIPLAIVCPDLQVTLLEATGKKVSFLQSVIDALALPNVRVVNDRAETAAHDRNTHRATYDVVTARAVGRLAVLLEITVPFAREQGYVVAIKGERAGEEVDEAKAALHLLHAQVTHTIRTETSTIVVIEKTRKTPRTYPRRPGEPKRAPLGIGAKAKDGA